MDNNHQIIILETFEGSAYNNRVLKEVWKYRLKNIAPHYKVLCVKIIKNKGNKNAR